MLIKYLNFKYKLYLFLKMTEVSDEDKSECEKVFKYLDTNKDKKLNADEVILGLGALGKICSMKEQKKIRSKAKYFDFDSFINICEQVVNFKKLENNLISYFDVLERKDKKGFINEQDLRFVLKKFDDNITEKGINDVIKELGDDSDGYINIEYLVKELLGK